MFKLSLSEARSMNAVPQQFMDRPLWKQRRDITSERTKYPQWLDGAAAPQPDPA
jgi:hypothetical protein